MPDLSYHRSQMTYSAVAVKTCYSLFTGYFPFMICSGVIPLLYFPVIYGILSVLSSSLECHDATRYISILIHRSYLHRKKRDPTEILL